MDERYAHELIALIAHFCGRVLTTYAWQALTSNTLLLVNVTPKERFNYKVLEASKKRGCRKKILSSCDSPKDIKLLVCISLRYC